MKLNAMAEASLPSLHSQNEKLEAKTVINANYVNANEIGSIGPMPLQLKVDDKSNKDNSMEMNWIRTCIIFDAFAELICSYILDRYSDSLRTILEDKRWKSVHWTEKKERMRVTLRNINSLASDEVERLFVQIDDKYRELSPRHEGHLKEHNHENIMEFCEKISESTKDKSTIKWLLRKILGLFFTMETVKELKWIPFKPPKNSWTNFETARRMFPEDISKGVIDDIQEGFEVKREFSGLEMKKPKLTDDFDENVHVVRDVEKLILEKADGSNKMYHYGIVGTGKSHLAKQVCKVKENCIYIDLHGEMEENPSPEILIQNLFLTIIRKCFSSVNLQKYWATRPQALLKDMLQGKGNLCFILDPIDSYKQVMAQFMSEVQDVCWGEISFVLFSRGTIYQLIEKRAIIRKDLGCFNKSESENYFTMFFNMKPQEDGKVLQILCRNFTLEKISDACFNNPKLMSIFSEKIYKRILEQGSFDDIDFDSLFKYETKDGRESEAVKVMEMMKQCIKDLSENAKIVLEAITLFPHNDINFENVVSLMDIEEVWKFLPDDACDNEHANENEKKAKIVEKLKTLAEEIPKGDKHDMIFQRRKKCREILRELEEETLIKRIDPGKYSMDPFVREMAFSVFKHNPFEFLKRNFVRLQFYHILGKKNNEGQGLTESSETQVRQTVTMLLNNYPKDDAFGILNLNKNEIEDIFGEFADHSEELIQHLQITGAFHQQREYIYFCQMFPPKQCQIMDPVNTNFPEIITISESDTEELEKQQIAKGESERETDRLEIQRQLEPQQDESVRKWQGEEMKMEMEDQRLDQILHSPGMDMTAIENDQWNKVMCKFKDLRMEIESKDPKWNIVRGIFEALHMEMDILEQQWDTIMQMFEAQIEEIKLKEQQYAIHLSSKTMTLSMEMKMELDKIKWEIEREQQWNKIMNKVKDLSTELESKETQWNTVLSIIKAVNIEYLEFQEQRHKIKSKLKGLSFKIMEGQKEIGKLGKLTKAILNWSQTPQLLYLDDLNRVIWDYHDFEGKIPPEIYSYITFSGLYCSSSSKQLSSAIFSSQDSSERSDSISKYFPPLRSDSLCVHLIDSPFVSRESCESLSHCPGGYEASCVAANIKGQIYLWGGKMWYPSTYGSSEILPTDIVIACDPEKGLTRRIQATGEIPLHSDNTASIVSGQTIYIFGGADDSSKPTNAISSLSIFGNFIKLRVIGDLPSPRQYHQGWSRGRKLFFIFGMGPIPDGGENGTLISGGIHVELTPGIFLLDEILEFDLEEVNFSVFQTSGSKPLPRIHFGIAKLGNKVYLHGGNYVKGGYAYDLFVLNLNIKIWTEIQIFGIPRGIACHTLSAISSTQLVSVGGRSESGDILNKVFIYDGEESTWRERRLPASFSGDEGGLFSHCAVEIERENGVTSVFCLGGYLDNYLTRPKHMLKLHHIGNHSMDDLLLPTEDTENESDSSMPDKSSDTITPPFSL